MQKKILFLAATTALVSANAQEKMMVDGHEAVDLGLSVLWATCNIGAENPEDAGEYFAWGDITGYAKGEEHNFNWENCFDTTDGKTFTIYHKNEGGLKELKSEHDAATQNWSNNWRMPSENELKELNSSCKFTWDNTKKGFNVKSNKTGNNNAIFLPAAGFGDKGGYTYRQTAGLYWSRSLYNNISHYATIYFIKYDNEKNLSFIYRYNGLSIRPVCEKSVVTKLNYVEKENANTVYKTIENGQIVIVKNGVKYNLAGQKL